ncbi:DUF1129 family protein [Metaplanococcus flavidus]|uniref:DUF1129 family protein n=1 Tax=Metaplanococcus flavidus TaxID=569883 RepID=A0ABW3LCB4_9BACL
MRSAALLIEENNQKRELLNEENLRLYEEFLLYIRTDLRVDEQAGEEVLMDLLDHLLEAQEEGKAASELFGESPQAYANEMIEALPKEKKRNAALFIFSQVLSLAGWFSIMFGVVSLIMSFFQEVDTSISLGNLLVIFGSVVVFSLSAVSVVFKIVRTTLFGPKKKRILGYVKAGLFGGGAVGLIILLSWIIPDFGPVIQLEWWVYVLTGLLLIAAYKLMGQLNLY